MPSYKFTEMSSSSIKMNTKIILGQILRLDSVGGFNPCRMSLFINNKWLPANRRRYLAKKISKRWGKGFAWDGVVPNPEGLMLQKTQ